MAKKRMFSLDIVDTDAFLDMPTSARLLYYDLCMRADDEGFVDKSKTIMRITGAAEDDMKILIAKGFVILFEDYGVHVIKHWFIHNYVRCDRVKPTNYTELREQLFKKKNKAYTLDYSQSLIGMQNDIPDDNLEESSREEDSIDKNRVEEVEQQLWTRIQNSWLKARMNVMSRMAQETLQSYLDDGMCVECIEYAIQQADANNARTLTYIKSILNRLVNNHITTPEALQADIQAKSATGRRKDSSVNEGVLSHGYTEKDFNDILNEMEEM